MYVIFVGCARQDCDWYAVLFFFLFLSPLPSSPLSRPPPSSLSPPKAFPRLILHRLYFTANLNLEIYKSGVHDKAQFRERQRLAKVCRGEKVERERRHDGEWTQEGRRVRDENERESRPFIV